MTSPILHTLAFVAWHVPRHHRKQVTSKVYPAVNTIEKHEFTTFNAPKNAICIMPVTSLSPSS